MAYHNNFNYYKEALFECCLCKRKPAEAGGNNCNNMVFYHCPNKHYYCLFCVQELKTGISNQMTCVICKYNGDFCEIQFNMTNFGHKPRHKYGLSSTNGFKHKPSTSNNTFYDEDKTFETLIGLPKEHFRKLQQQKELYHETKSLYTLKRVQSKINSRKPLKCPHRPCHKTVATSQFVNHFKSEHCNIPTISLERNRVLCLPFDVTVIEHGCHYCLAMITVYEINRIDFVGSKSSESVIRTASKFCQKLPINTFWLMVTGSKKTSDLTTPYSIVWLFTNTEENYKCTLELSSTNDTYCLSTYCDVNNFLVDDDFLEVADHLKCLLATNFSLKSLLKEGVMLNLRVTIH